MSRIGVIFAAYNAADFLPKSLPPWIEAKASGVGGHEWLICAVSVPFTGFPDQPRDNTRSILGEHAQYGRIDHAVVSDKPMAETDARGNALRWLVANGATDIWQADADEFPTVEQIGKIAAFWAARPHLCWARLSLKNRVFTPDQYLVKPFTPPRLHRVTPPGHSGYEARSFYQDNNVTYHGRITRDMVPDTSFPSITVPQGVAWIDHESWVGERARLKVKYQQGGRGWTCTFDWDDTRGGLIWRDGVEPQETARD